MKKATSGTGGGKKRGNKKPLERDTLQLDVCDVSNDDFKKTWLALKELHDKELYRLQTELTILRKERLADERLTDSIAKIKELTEQQKVLSAAINELRDKLCSKACDQCIIHETYRNTLQQDIFHIHQQNVKFISELTAERNKLREKNKILSKRLKLSQQQLRRPPSDSDDDFIPCSQRPKSVFTVKEPTQGTQVYLPLRKTKYSYSELMKPGGKKEQEKSSQSPVLFSSEKLSVVPEASFEKTASNERKPNTGHISDPRSSAGFPLIFAESPQRGHGFQAASNRPEDKVGQPKSKQSPIQKTSSQKSGTEDFSWSLSSISMGTPSPIVISDTSEKSMGYGFQAASNLSEDKVGQPKSKQAPIQKTSSQKSGIQDFSWSPSSISMGKPSPIVISDTLEKSMSDWQRKSFSPLTQRKGTPYSGVFPLDYTLRRKNRLLLGIPHYSKGLRDGSNQAPSNEQLILRKNTDQSTGAAGYGADKPQEDPQSPNFGSRIKRKAVMPPRRRK